MTAFATVFETVFPTVRSSQAVPGGLLGSVQSTVTVTIEAVEWHDGNVEWHDGDVEWTV